MTNRGKKLAKRERRRKRLLEKKRGTKTSRVLMRQFEKDVAAIKAIMSEPEHIDPVFTWVQHTVPVWWTDIAPATEPVIQYSASDDVVDMLLKAGK